MLRGLTAKDSIRWTSVLVITARKRSLGLGNVFTHVCHSVHKMGLCMTSLSVWLCGPMFLPGGGCSVRGRVSVRRRGGLSGGEGDMRTWTCSNLFIWGPPPAPSCSPAQMGKPEPNLAPQDMFTWTSPYNHTFSNSIEFNIYHPHMWVGNVFSHFCLCVCLFRL